MSEEKILKGLTVAPKAMTEVKLNRINTLSFDSVEANVAVIETVSACLTVSN